MILARLPNVVLAGIATTALLTGSVSAAAGLAPAPLAPPAPPTAPAPGALGGAGPCGRAEQIVSQADNTTLTGTPLNVYIETPTGSGSTPLVGGQCNSLERPVVFFAHGFGVGTPSSYASLLDHWVSNGNIVVMADYDAANPSLPATFVQVDRGNVAAVAVEPRIDTTRAGIYGYSHGGGMTPYLSQQADGRGWGSRGLWMTSLSQAYTQFEGTGGPIALPARERVMVVAGDDDLYADLRNGNDVFRSITLPATRKSHITLHSDAHGYPTLDASHAIVTDSASNVDAMDFALWRLSDILESCSLRGKNCSADLSTMGVWSDGTPVTPATVSATPVDEGPSPVVLAECDGTAFAVLDNPRIAECGPTSL
jgi:dienelactone hydrolase